MKDIVNTKLKFREPVRPFAPSVLEEHAPRYFDLGDDTQAWPREPAKFMLAVLPIAEAERTTIPAVCHAGGTGRLQTVTREGNGRYHKLIERFGQATGVPVILNTSFNLRGEPIVTTPDNALNTFYNSGIDTLVLGDFMVRKDRAG